MKYILRTLWIIGLIPMFLLGLAFAFVYLMVGFPLILAFIFIKTGSFYDIPFLDDIVEWFIDKYGGLLDKIK